MRYERYDELGGRPNVVVDGSPTEGTTLNVTHWPGYPPPPPLRADLSAQSAFLLLERPDLVPAGTELVSNNHFDQDGLVSVFALTEPAAALARRAFLEDVAAAGDFGTYRRRDAARVSMLVSTFAHGDGDRYPEALERLPEWCDHTDRFRDQWADEDAALAASEAPGAFTVAERPDVDLAVVTVAATTSGGHRFGGGWVDGLHPMAVNNATDRFVVARLAGRRYEVELRYETWVQYRSRPVRARRDLVPLADRLNDEERGGVEWSATPVGGLTPKLTMTVGESSIDPGRFVELLVAHLAEAPPAWDPFRSR